MPSRCQILNGVKHPFYGSGLLVLQALPLAPPTESEGAGLALAFNGIELAREPLGYGFGSYAWRDQRMYFISFLPNALYRHGAAAEPRGVLRPARPQPALHPLAGGVSRPRTRGLRGRKSGRRSVPGRSVRR